MMRPTVLCTAIVIPLLTTSPAAAQRTAPTHESVRAAVDAHRRGHEMAVMEELRTLLALPNVASDEGDIRRNAALLIRMLARRGVEARLLEVDGAPPAVYGELRVPGATRTIMLYAHFDGQPVDEADWATPPWTPTLRAGRLEEGAAVVDWPSAQAPLEDDWRVYARSASDDKSPIVAYLAALDALRAAGIAPSVNLKFFLEGEEEAGSTHLRALLQRHRPLLGADVWIFGDGPVNQTGRMQVVYGVRGITGVQLTVYGPTRALHSGHYGNWAPNPAAMLAQLVASLRDDNGLVRIDGFYDDVRPVSPAEREALAALPAVEEALLRELALGRTEGNGERLMSRILLPALNVTGLSAGGVGTLRRNAVPTEATVTIDFRLVPDMAPARVRERLEAHVRGLGYHVVQAAPAPEILRAHPRVVRMTWEDGYAAVRTPLDLPVARAVARVVDDMLEGASLHVPMLGGSLPLAIFEEVLGAPLIIVPMVNADNNQHAANENLRIGNFWSGVSTYAGLMARLGPEWDAAAAPAPAGRGPGGAVQSIVGASMGSTQASQPRMSAEAAAYLVAALDTLQVVTLGRETLPWAVIRDSVFYYAHGARKPSDTYGAIDWALRRANKHSFLQAARPGAVSELIDGRYGYIRVPQRGGAAVALADSLHNAVRSLAAGDACGWIVDLRGNGGGNMWPMLAGIGPLFGDSVVGYFGSGPEAQGWYYSRGISGILHPGGGVDTASRVTVDPFTLPTPLPPVAVLLDGGTGSSGEALAVAFLGRPATRSFGQPTAGFATVNRGSRLPDGANMVVTTGYYADRSRAQIAERVEPDESVPRGVEGWPFPADRVAEAAARWLASRPACATGS